MKKLSILLSLIFISFSLTACFQANNSKTKAPSSSETAEKPKVDRSLVNATALQQKISAGENLRIIDVRTANELKETGIIKGAYHLDYRDRAAFQKGLMGMDREQPVVFYCAKGGRSKGASNIAEGLGFKTIYDLEGGMTDWQAAKQETVEWFGNKE